MGKIQFPAELLKNSQGEKVSTADALKGVDILGIYFYEECIHEGDQQFHSCHQENVPVEFTNYNALKKAGYKVEIIFASADKDEADFNKNFAKMTWLAMPFEFRKEFEALSQRYDERMPYLVFVNPQTWETMTKLGIQEIRSEYFIENFPFSNNSTDLSIAIDNSWIYDIKNKSLKKKF